ncbi:MAG: adenine deaminase [Ferruginibacter sp.]
MDSFTLEANIVDIPARKIFYGQVGVEKGKIVSLVPAGPTRPGSPFILPGFIDSHVHVESSMLVPSEFAKLAVVHGTTGTISDPHEIANVCGLDGVKFMIENGKTVPFKFHFGAPSCVPATVFETAGAALHSDEVETLLAMPEINYLSEMMNFPGVLFADEEVMKKIAAAKKYNKPVDGHAPGLRGADAKKYIDAGISTDHECFTAAEALEKLGYGMKILVREGSAAKNFEALIPLMEEHYEHMMFCSDDKHPDSLELGHINQLCARAVAKGIDVFKVLQAACINPVQHYSMRNGTLKAGDAADFIISKDLVNFEITHTYIDGMLLAENGKSLIESKPAVAINQFSCSKKSKKDFALAVKDPSAAIPVIGALEGQLITEKLWVNPKTENGFIISDTETDVLKIAVVNRYQDAPVAVSFIKNIGLKEGALASSVAHDSHNIVAVGADDESIARAVNLVIAEKGGISAVGKGKEMVLGLPVAGLMSTGDGYQVASAYTAIDNFVKNELGSTMGAPFMTLSFMALLVIPHLKLSDKGLFDGDSFSFVD